MNKLFWITCPVCGRKISKSMDVTLNETVCPDKKCRVKFSYYIDGNKMAFNVLDIPTINN